MTILQRIMVIIMKKSIQVAPKCGYVEAQLPYEKCSSRLQILVKLNFINESTTELLVEKLE
jgi:hypothetical protein